ERQFEGGPAQPVLEREVSRTKTHLGGCSISKNARAASTTRGPGTTKMSEATAKTRRGLIAVAAEDCVHRRSTARLCSSLTPTVSDMSPMSTMISGLRAITCSRETAG